MAPIRFFLCFASICLVASASTSVCPRSDWGFLEEIDGGGSRCPAWIPPLSPRKVTGEALDMELSRGQKNKIYSVLFYASWCPFSYRGERIFDALCSMFPQIRHLSVEESSALPSVFSRYGVHSFPSVLLVNQRGRFRYQGPMDLSSLIAFYKKFTGLEPVAQLAEDKEMVILREKQSIWSGSPRNIMRREPYLAFSLIFICIRAFIHFFPGVLHSLKSFWISYVCRMNLGIYGGSCHLVNQALHLVDMKRLWSKVRICNKTRNFRKGANNARAWASSLTSVSLGESSSPRTAPTET